MARVGFVEKADASPDVQQVYAETEQAFGGLLNIFKAIAHNPDFLKTLWTGFQGLGRVTLDPKLRELAYLTTSVTNRCEY